MQESIVDRFIQYLYFKIEVDFGFHLRSWYCSESQLNFWLTIIIFREWFELCYASVTVWVAFGFARISDMVFILQIYDFDRDYKDVGVAQFTTKYFVVRNCLPHAKSDMLLSAWNPPPEWGKYAFFSSCLLHLVLLLSPGICRKADILVSSLSF